MDIFGIDIGQIADLATQIAHTGAIRLAEVAANEVYEDVAGIVVLAYEIDPGTAF